MYLGGIIGMRHVTTTLLVAMASVAATCGAAADSNSIGLTITSNRNPNNFGIPRSTKYQFNARHTFDSGLNLGGSFEFSDTAFSDRASKNLEGTIGYGIPLNYASFLTVSAGIGERWHQNPSNSFPYYVLRIGLNFELTQDITWNAIAYRFRDAFDADENYNTPQIATGLTFKVDENSSITAKVARNWRDGSPSSTGISLDFKRRF